ncbi:MAG: hypothetical protein ACYTGN_10700 [Planctomycetota bacterium]|jgi:hypothetical protein
MRNSLVVALLFCACQATTKELPEGQVEYHSHPEFASIDPTAIAVLKVDAPDKDVAEQVRRILYDGLFSKNYSCLKLKSVDDNTSNGEVDGRALAYDATLKVTVTKWEQVEGGAYYLTSGRATMVHRQGQELWSYTFTDDNFQGEVAAGSADDLDAMRNLARRILTQVPERQAPAK